MPGKGCLRPLLWIGGIVVLMWVAVVILAIVIGEDGPSRSAIVSTPRPKNTPTPTRTPITYTAANLATHTAVVANRKKTTATSFARKSAVSRSDHQKELPSVADLVACTAWFDTFDKYHLLNLADLETIADTMNPEGSYYHYGSKSEVREAVHFHADLILQRAKEIKRTLPHEMPDNVRFPKDRYADAYYNLTVLLINNFDGSIGSAPWFNRLNTLLRDVEEVNGAERRAVSDGKKYCR